MQIAKRDGVCQLKINSSADPVSHIGQVPDRTDSNDLSEILYLS